ncbi:MAG: hypothetical protein IKD55_07820 [Sediminibacterium sp.]|nr:hypothetical protein [Sediminibacterium sp.]
MNPTKKQLLKIAYQRVLAVTLIDMKAPLKWADEYVSESITGFGTAADEKVFSKKDYRAIVINSRKQAKGLVFKCELKTKYNPKFTGENTACFFDEFIVTVGKGSRRMVMPLSLGLVFEFYDNKWKLIGLYASKIDTDTSSEDTFHLGEAEKKMQELQMQVAKRTEELSQKNNELKIEAALERVRAIAMSMNKADDMLLICKAISEQLKILGVKEIRNVQTAIFYESKGTYMNYEYYAKHNKTFITGVEYKKHKIQLAFAQKMMKGPNEEFVEQMKGKKLQDWYAYQKTTNQFADKYLLKAHSLNYYWFSLGPVALGISTYYPLTKVETGLFKRFLKVFELAYRRYLDIEQATAQAREAKIEAALERVRAASMAMHKSEELAEVILSIDKEISTLNINIDNSSIITDFRDLKTGLNNWIAVKGRKFLQKFYIPYSNDHLLTKRMKRAIKTGEHFYVEQYSKSEKNTYFKWLFKYSDFRNLPDDRKEYVLAREGWTRVLIFSKNSFLIFQRYDRRCFTNEEVEIFKRFGKVFEQAYTRFLDLQKAEAQAIEAQIEAALERVRAKSMAMHTSSEIMEVVYLIADQLKDLRVQSDATSIIILHDDAYEYWNANNQQTYANSQLQKIDKSFDGVVNQDIIKHSKLTKDFSRSYSKQEKNKHWKWLFRMEGGFKYIPEQRKKFILSQPHYNLAVSFTKKIALVLVKYQSATAYTDPERAVLKRFAEVFDQCYTRFLDLQKAEEQAREAQIEAALERVRAKSMAMQQPNELREVAELLRKEMGVLGIEALETSSIYLVHPTITECWYAIKDVRQKNAKLLSDYMEIQLSETWVGREMQKFYKGRQKQASIVMKGNHRKEWINYCAGKSSGLKNYYGKEIPERTYHVLKFAGGYMGAVSPGELSSENWDVLGRATTVFALAYTRFKDLQESANRAREAQIELALERVRAKSMAMHKSDELKEVIKVVLEQLVHLNIKAEHAGFYIDYKAHDDMHIWLADPNIDPFYAVLPYFDSPTWKSFLDAKTTGKSFYTDLLDYKAKNKFYKSLFNIFNVPEEAQQFYLKCKGLAVSTVLLENVGLYIENFSAIPYTEEENKILMRFAKVFEQSYTRFLDLQKAEAQAREAQIEVALERVRTNAMALRDSKELSSIITIIFKELQNLGLAVYETGIYLRKENSREFTVWGKSVTDDDFFTNYEFAFVDHYILNQVIKNLDSNIPYATFDLIGNEVKDYLDFYFSLEQFKTIPQKTRKQYYAVKKIFVAHAYFQHGFLEISGTDPLPIEMSALLKRFTQVIDLAYTRFLDLQKAEAQAREAQIQLALERVRARTMAMQRSEELLETSLELFQQLKELGEPAEQLTIGVIKEKENIVEVSATVNGLKLLKTFGHDINEPFVMNKMYKAWKAGIKTMVIEQDWKELQAYNRYRNKLVQEELFSLKFKPGDKRILYVAFHSKGTLVLSSNEPRPKETLELLIRFSAVFEEAYTRFLDLQRAEAQARESQIQLALERVRGRTMAMQKSDELAETAALLFHQVKSLGIESYSSGFTVWENNDEELVSWMCNADGSINPPFRMPTKEVEWHRKQYKSWKHKEEYIIYDFKGKEMQQHYAYLRSFPLLDEAFKKSEVAGVVTPPRQVHNAFNFSQGNLLFITLEPVPEAHDIFKRFAKVFEQTYTRFLDLQKAEALAREAKIETALERIRSRTMGMQKSDELNEVAFILFEQIRILGGQLWGTGFVLCDVSEGEDQFWFANEMGVRPPVNIPNTEDEVHIGMLQGWKENHDYLRLQKEGQALADHYRYLSSLPQMKAFFDPMLSAGFEFPSFQQWHAAYFSKGYLLFITTEPYAEPDLFKRFAKVFDQTYTRFLDLQKAEAQAREAQIEAALERVRSRSLAMHKSDELQQVVTTLFDQLHFLNIENDATGIVIFKPDTNHFQYWFANAERSISSYFLLEYKKFSFTNELSIAHQSGEAYFHKIYSKEEKNEFYTRILTETDFTRLSDERKKLILESEGFTILAPLNKNTALQLNRYYKKSFSDIDIEVARRFGNVFEQAYTRFLDLQKAEAQTREAQVEAALERVRYRAMAMQTSADVGEATATMFAELDALGIETFRCGIAICKDQEMEVWSVGVTTEGKMVQGVGTLDIYLHPLWELFYKQWSHNEEFLYYFLKDKEKEDYVRIIKNTTSYQLTDKKINFPDLHFQSYFFSEGGIFSFSIHAHTEEEKWVMKRFAKVFALTYKRYEDLKLAEAQARESQIQLALERIRARTMAMQKSEELPETSLLLFQQMKELGETAVQNSIGILKEEEGVVELSTTVQGQAEPRSLRVPMDDPHIMAKAVAALKAKQKSLIVEIKGEELKEYNKFRNGFLERKTNFPEDNWIVNVIFFSKGWLSFSSNHKISDESFQLLERFAAVFEQTYTRFLDLQRAEAQAREAQIEAALERVRSKAMAMHNSSDLPSTAIIAFSELKKLGFVPIRGGISIQNKENRKNLLYSATTTEQGDNLSIVGWALLDNHPVLTEIYNHWIEGKDYYPELHGELLKSYYEQVSTSFNVPAEQTEIDQYGYFMYFTHGVFYGWCNQPVNEDEKKLLKRFASVIDLTFKRYFDLQKAEEQAREAQIEASLEKVRSVAMSMHHSNELLNICEAIYAELIKLGMIELRNTMINIHNDAEETFLNYDYSAYAGRAVTKYGYHIHPIINHLVMQCRSAQDAFVDIAFDGKEFEEWRSFRKASGEKDDARLKKITHLHYYFYSIGIGSIGISTFESIDEQKMALLKRFRNVFQLAYQRFTDLSAAEAQAREAQIETALERVRSRTMAMQNSNELSATVQVMFEECRKLQPISTDSLSRGFITTIHQSKKMFDLWITEIDGTKIDTQFKISFDEPTTGIHIHKAWKQKKPYFINDLQGPVLEQWLDYLESTGFKIAPGIRGTRRVNTFIFYSNGFIGITSSVPLEEENIQILQRFAKVFDQTYTRFLDLQKAEAAAKEAIKQAALDRIRADIASMRTIEDLNRITPLIWNELTILGVRFIRCGVFIMDEEVEQIHTFLSTPDGKSIAAFHLSFTESENIIDVVSHWRNKKVYSNHWDEKDFDVLADSLVKQKAITTKSSYLQSIPATGIHLNFLPFLQGMLYVGNEMPLKPDEIDLLQAVADAFSTAYARYEDFNKLEAAKQVVEKTLNELKSTQQQLIQSEKMASLGELTAGIAHEIQNPLNFVNNFSELNVELLEELQTEMRPLLAEGEVGVTALIDDIKNNSEKINHHGQRAASIVKGMLQHSRSSSATKELTDINALCDEYLRLAYHGLRAKDKSFNAEFKTEFDATIPKVSIVPQDMGRVVLNLINNAFFAVGERGKAEGGSHKVEAISSEEKGIPSGLQPTPYSPIVTVSTKNLGNKIEIRVTDNGTGIPSEIKEKIFQPFFTTKPTGQGTGLGLSLAYDIVTKAHGGELRVESEEGKGTVFKIII